MDKFQDPLVVDPSDGNVRGATDAFPNKGTTSGMVGMGAPYGADIGVNATNSRGSAHMAPDPAELCYPKGDSDLRFSSSGHSSPDPGSHMGSVTNSDAPDDETPINPKQ